MINPFRIKLLFMLWVAGAAAWSSAGAEPASLYFQWNGLVQSQGQGSVQWLPGGQGYLEVKRDNASGSTTFLRVDPLSGRKAELFDPKFKAALLTRYGALTGRTTRALPFRAFDYAADGQGILFTDDGGTRYYAALAGGRLSVVKPPTPPVLTVANDPLRFVDSRLVTAYSPDYSHYAWVSGYDIYACDLATGQTNRLTRGGSEEFGNGVIDWVYNEELEDRRGKALWWSPDSKKIAYLQFDERSVRFFPIVHEFSRDRNPLYASTIEMERFPKTGQGNPTVRLFVVDVTTGKNVEMATGASPETYLTRIAWKKDSSQLFFQRLNRPQTQLELMAADPATGQSRTILTEKDDCYINLNEDFTPLADGKRFIWSSERNGFKHLYLYDFNGRLLRPLTSGEWEAGVLKVDEKKGLVYFEIVNNHGMDKHLGVVGLNGRGFKDLTPEPGTHAVTLDPEARFFSDRFSSFTTPPQTSLHQADGRLIRQIGSSDVSRVKELGLVAPEVLKLKAADGQTDLYGVLFKPAGFDPAKKYPLLLSVYGGPIKMNFNTYQTAGPRARMAQLGFLVFEVDNRGTPQQGKKFMTAAYLKSGQVDVDDQAAAVRQLRELPYVDAARVGMTGASYGGYMTLMSLLRYPDLYQVGVAVSAPSDWRNYDTIYTERYMKKPADNPDGYSKASALTYAANLKGKLLVVHGETDDNVHAANMMHLLDRLQREGKEFDVMFYPENRHGIGGYNAEHLRKTRLGYFLKNLKPEGWEESYKQLWSSSEMGMRGGRGAGAGGGARGARGQGTRGQGAQGQ